MSLLQTIRAAALQARKDRATVAANLLTTLGSEAAMVGKNNGNRESTDDEVQAVVRKFLKGNSETLGRVTDPAVRAQYEEEREILSRYVPTELSEAELRELIGTLGGKDSIKIGTVMAALNQRFPGRVNGKLVKQILDDMASA